jgi:peptidoglycan/xylan/chitin deacetylase (PgdA/CDA1 family)
VSGAVPVLLSFDVDGDESWRVRRPGESPTTDLGALSWGRYGIVRGLPRIVGLLARLDVRCTFFVPGVTAEAHPAAIEALAAAGHEVAHHGHHHFAPAGLSEAEQEQELERGSEALRRCTGVAPAGYRAPCWQMTEHTLVLLCECGFAYDSSLMADDRPYLERVGERALVELPVHWALDDVPQFGALPGDAGPLRDPRQVFDLWWLEVESAIAEQRGTSFCFHPEVVGRAWAFAPFEQFLSRLHHDPRVTLERCIDVARALPQAVSDQRESHDHHT